MNKCLLVSCNPTDHIINPDSKLFIDSMREGRGKSIFDSGELTSNQIDNFKTCLSLSCRVNISNFDVFLFSRFYTLQYCNALQFKKIIILKKKLINKNPDRSTQSFSAMLQEKSFLLLPRRKEANASYTNRSKHLSHHRHTSVPARK